MCQLTPMQDQVLAGLLAGKSVSGAAKENGIHRSTIYHWRHEHSRLGLALEQACFRQQVNLYDSVQDLTEQALETVATMFASEDANLRLRAAQAILRVAEFDTIRQNSTVKSEPTKSDTNRQNPTRKFERARNWGYRDL